MVKNLKAEDRLMMMNKCGFARIGAVVGAVCTMLVLSANAHADQSDWVQGYDNKARLIAIAKPREGSKAAYAAGLEIQMSPGFKTYWRSPGEAGGVPPEFDWTGSDNLASAQVLYPAPHRLIDKAGANIGYKDHVIFPVEITPQDPSKPVKLHLKAVYGVCKNICIPAEVEMEFEVSDKTEIDAELASAVASVPKLLDVAEKKSGSTAPVLDSWRIEKRGSKAMLVMDVAGEGAEGDVFLFSDEGIYLPMTNKVKPNLFEADLTDAGDLKDLAGKKIWVTMVGTKGQSETLISLPEDIAKP